MSHVPHRPPPAVRGTGGSRPASPLPSALLVAGALGACWPSPSAWCRRSRASAPRTSSRPPARPSTACSRAARPRRRTLRALVTELPVFRAHLTDSRLAADRPTIEAMADGYRSSSTPTFAVVTDADGTWLASPGLGRVPESPAAGARWVDGSMPRGRAVRQRASSPRGGALFLVVSRAGALRRRGARHAVGRLRAHRCPGPGTGAASRSATSCCWPGTAVAATQPRRHRRTPTRLAGGRGRGGRPSVCCRELPRIGDYHYVGGTFPLSPGRGGRAARAAACCWPTGSRRRSSSIDCASGSSPAALVVFGLALARGLVFSRRVSEPLREIAAAATDIAGGNSRLQLPARGSAEGGDRGAGVQRDERQPARRPGPPDARRHSRSADAPAEQDALHRAARARHGPAGPPPGLPVRRALRRSGSVQARQRQPRPRRRRPAAASPSRSGWRARSAATTW